MTATALEEKRWRVVGIYPDGKPLRFSINAFDHQGAMAKAEKMKGSAKIIEIACAEPRASGAAR